VHTNFIIDYGAEMIIPAISYVYGKGVTKTGYPESRSVQIYGRFTGVANFILGFETLVYIGENDDCYECVTDHSCHQTIV
jgi:hypothetical protein